MTPTEFVRARIADREADADQIHDSDCRLVTWGVSQGWCDCTQPDRVRARCAVDRRILEEHETIRARYTGATIEDAPCCKTCSNYGEDPGEYPCATVALLASLDADHPDYDKNWWPL